MLKTVTVRRPAPGARSRSAYRQLADSHARPFKNDDTSLVEMTLHPWKVGEEHFDLPTRHAGRCVPEEDHRRPRVSPQCEQGPKVGVRGDDHTSFALGSLEDLRVARGLHAVVADVNRVMARGAQASGNNR